MNTLKCSGVQSCSTVRSRATAFMRYSTTSRGLNVKATARPAALRVELRKIYSLRRGGPGHYSSSRLVAHSAAGSPGGGGGGGSGAVVPPTPNGDEGDEKGSGINAKAVLVVFLAVAAAVPAIKTLFERMDNKKAKSVEDVVTLDDFDKAFGSSKKKLKDKIRPDKNSETYKLIGIAALGVGMVIYDRYKRKED